MGERMGDLASQTGRKLMAVGVLLVAAYVLFKLVIGFITSVAVIAVAVLAVVAVIWALRVL